MEKVEIQKIEEEIKVFFLGNLDNEARSKMGILNFLTFKKNIYLKNMEKLKMDFFS